PGCSSGEELDQLREKQRQIGPLYNDVELFSTSGISQHYGCHYGPDGYVELATFLIRNIAKQYYNGTDTVNIRPPNIKHAFYSDNRTKIKILFEGSRIQSWPADTVYGDVTIVNHSMKDYIYLDGVYGNISGGTVSGDTLILNLITPSFATKISYLPASRDLTDQQVYEGPFLRNPRRLGALSFFEFPIADSLVTAVSLQHLIYSVNNRDVTLNWTTVSEENNAGFEVYRIRKDDNADWTKVGFVQGSGTSFVPVNYFYNDIGLNSGRYNYKLKQIDFNGNFEFFSLNNEVNIGLPPKFLLYQNYPNPFNPNTKIEFDTPAESDVTIKLYDISGKVIKTIVKNSFNAGYHIVQLNSSDLPSGIYYYTIYAASNGNEKFIATKKMVVVK
ncbi:MAG: T9SS type A sorting domain-containing protein, partial [Ignavibacteria bacterium]